MFWNVWGWERDRRWRCNVCEGRGFTARGYGLRHHNQHDEHRQSVVATVQKCADELVLEGEPDVAATPGG